MGLLTNLMEPASAPGAGERIVDAVRVESPGRLHLGFLDPSATLGRRFGSVGVAIDGLSTTVEVALDDSDAFVASEEVRADLGRLKRHVERLRRVWRLEAPLRVTLHSALPPHAGFGSGTQLALAIGHAFAAVHGLSVATGEVAHVLARGERSGVGVAAFVHGGFVVDGGHGAATTLPPVLSRLEFPRAWRIVLVIEGRAHGLHGGDEAEAIAALPPFAPARAAELCHELVMRVLPGIAEADFERFAAGVSRIQYANGGYFASAQGGGMYVSRAVGRVLDWARQRFPAAVGQSSWGPTGFAFVPSQSMADELVAAAHTAGLVDANVRLVTVRGRNRGAEMARRVRGKRAAFGRAEIIGR